MGLGGVEEFKSHERKFSNSKSIGPGGGVGGMGLGNLGSDYYISGGPIREEFTNNTNSD